MRQYLVLLEGQSVQMPTSFQWVHRLSEPRQSCMKHCGGRKWLANLKEIIFILKSDAHITFWSTPPLNHSELPWKSPPSDWIGSTIRPAHGLPILNKHWSFFFFEKLKPLFVCLLFLSSPSVDWQWYPQLEPSNEHPLLRSLWWTLPVDTWKVTT